MNDMKELIDERTAELIIRIIGMGGPVAGLVLGAIVGLFRKSFLRSMIQGLGLGCFGILIWVTWIYYSWMVRYDPKTGYAGLHKVSVLLINLLVFSAVGAIIGGVWGWMARRKESVQRDA